MGFISAVTNCLRQYATFSGKASRSEFWWFALFQLLVVLLVGLSVSNMAHGEIVFSIIYLGLFLPAFAVGARRLHDVGRSGWWWLLTLTGIGSLVLLYWWIQPSKK